MSFQRSYIRLILEIAAIVALAEAGVLFVLPIAAPGAARLLEGVLNAAMLSASAGPLIAWRVRGRSDEFQNQVRPDRAAARWRPMAASGLVVGLGLLVTALSTLWVWNATERDARQRFDIKVERVRAEAVRRMNLFAYGLKGARALFAGSERVERDEFRSYTDSRQLSVEFPGALGVGFIERVPREKLEEWTEATREDGRPGFTVQSDGSAAELYVAKYIEPAENNLPALGCDFAPDAARREAAERAMRTGDAVISAAVKLEQDKLGRRGLLYLLPVYKKDSKPTTEAQRVEACIGWTYSPILMEEALGGLTRAENGMIDIEVFDGTSPSVESMLYDDDGTYSRDAHIHRRFERNSPLTMGGRQWTLHFTGRPAFDKSARPLQAMAVAGGGVLMSVLICGMVWILSTSRTKAIMLAVGMTSELKQAKDEAELTMQEQAASLGLLTALAKAEDISGAANAVLASVAAITGIERFAVLLFPGKPGDSVCRFVGSRGLGNEHQSAIDSFCPWPQSELDAAPILIRDAASDASTTGYRDLFTRNDIGTAAVIPVQTDEGIVGKLMLFHATPGAITQRIVEGALVAAGFLGMSVSRLLAQARTRDSENLFRLLVEGGDEFVNLMTTDRKALYVSPSYFRLTGWTAADLDAADFTTRIHPEDLERVLRARDANLAGKPTRIEYRALKKDGSFVWLDLRATPVLDETGTRVDRILCFSRDVTESKDTEQRLRRSEHRLQLAVRGSQDGLWDVEHTTGVTWRSDRLLEMQGYARDELAPTLKPWHDHLHPEDKERVLAAFDRHTREDAPYDVEFRYKRKTGEYRWFRSRGQSIRNAEGRAIRTAGSTSDIHERREAEQRLEESERRMRAIIEGADVIAWEYDVAGARFTYVSPQASRLGYPMEEWLTPRFWQNHIHPEDREWVIEKCMEESRAGRNNRFQYRLIRADGGWMWVDDFVSVEMRGDTVTMLRGVLIDVTESRRLRDMAEAASAAKSEFLANMSHEIRTPLTAILGYTQLLAEDGNPEAAAQRRDENLATIRRAGEHLLTVVNDILDLSKIEAGRMEVEEIECDLPRLLSEIGSLMGARAKEKGINLEVRLGNAVPNTVITDPTRLRQILLNLVGNAVKFTEQGKVQITATVNDSVLCVDVADTGPGLSEAQVEQLFVPFAQADTSVTRRYGGTGLGLTICRRLASIMGGSVSLQRTDPGHGSVFRVVLPLKEVRGTVLTKTLGSVGGEAEVAAAPLRLNGRILLAEDGVDNQRLIAFHLKKAGARLDIADNGLMALKMIQNAGDDEYNLILTDMQMPEMDGYTLARTLRETGSRTPIIALTAHAMAEDRRKCIESGCDDYASKPIDKSALIRTCAYWMGRQGGAGGQQRAA